MKIDPSKSLEELNNEFWDDPEFKSHVVIECHKLRKIPISKLTVENLRILIGQKIGLKFLVPIALDLLENDPLSEGDMYKGDLLAAVASINGEFWNKNPDFNNRLVGIKNDLAILSETIVDELLPALNSFNFKEKL